MPLYLYSIWLSIPLMLLGCSSDTGNTEANLHQEAESKDKQEPFVVLRFNGKEIRTIKSSQLGHRTELLSFLPEENQATKKWLMVAGQGGARKLNIEPSLYPGASLELYLDQGLPTLALFRPLPPDAPAHVQKELTKPHLRLSPVSRIDIRTKEVGPEVSVGFQPLRIQFNDKTVAELGRPEFVALPKTQDFVAESKKKWQAAEQYHLLDIIRPYVQRPNALQSLTLHSQGKSLSIRLETLHSENIRPLLKRNKRGEWIFRSYKRSSDGIQQELRGVVRIEIHVSAAP